MKRKKRDLYFVGDIHGNFRQLFENIFNKRIKNSDIIVCGDIGIGFRITDRELGAIKDCPFYNGIKNWENRIFCIRGNHDDPSHFDCRNISRDLGLDFDIILVRDYALLKLDRAQVLSIGGGISIDRNIRQEGISYWKNEDVVLRGESEFEKISNNLSEELPLVIATHIAPPNGKPTPDPKHLAEIMGFMYTYDVQKDDEESRDKMGKIRELVIKHFYTSSSPKINWFYGHYHKSFKRFYDETEKIIYNPLNIQQIKKYKCTETKKSLKSADVIIGV